MANTGRAKQNSDLRIENASSSIRTAETPDNDNRSTMRTENEELVRRMDLLEKVLNDRLSSEDIQIKQLQERVQQLEDQVTQYKTQVKILEDKVTSRWKPAFA